LGISLRQRREVPVVSDFVSRLSCFHFVTAFSLSANRLRQQTTARAVLGNIERAIIKLLNTVPGYSKHARISDLIFLIACCTSSHRRHSMRLTPHACPVHRSRYQLTPQFFAHCGWLTNDGR